MNGQWASRTRRGGRDGGGAKVAIALAVTLVLFLAVAGSGLLALLGNPALPGGPGARAVPQVRPADRITILALGLDEVITNDGRLLKDRPLDTWGRRADTVILISVDPETRQVGIVSLPRDIKVDIPWRPDLTRIYQNKLNAVYASVNPKDGPPQKTMEVVGALLGVRIDHYVRFSYDALIRLVDDHLRGLRVDVERDMKYTDPYQALYINLKQGDQILTGQQVLHYARYRGDNDLYRIKRQQNVIRLLTEELTKLANIWRIPLIAADMVKYVDSSLNLTQAASLALDILRRRQDYSMEMDTLPGEIVNTWDNGYLQSSYYVMDEAKAGALVRRLIHGIDEQAHARVTVQVLNGSGVPGKEAAVADALRAEGFQVVATGQTPRQDYAVTQVIGHTDSDEALRLTARAVFRVIPGAALFRLIKLEPVAQVTVIVGTD